MATRKRTTERNAAADAAAGASASNPLFFPSAAAFGKWLEKHHASAEVLWVGFHRKATGRPSLTWNESVDEALRFGWIDGVRKSVDDGAYTIRFTARKPGSIWSAKNIKRMNELIAAGVVAPAGLAAFERRTEERSRRYSFEQDAVGLPADVEEQFRANRKAWAFWEAQPPGYRKTATWWMISAKRADTRQRRLETLIADCASGERIKELRRS
jgi:uncharacterized protein YdeI (YjbR/CyaY-like superfamily)